MASVIAITSGKGGVGKTNVTTNLGLALVERQCRVCIFDADTGLANINILLAIAPQYTLEHVLSGEKSIAEITVTTPQGLAIVPAASGIARCVDLDEQQLQKLVVALQELEERYDFILIDTAAGIDKGVLEFVASALYQIIIITPEPTSLTDAFALLKMLLARRCARSVYILVNMVKDYQASRGIFRRFHAAVKKYLHFNTLRYLGYLPDDVHVSQAVSKQVPVVLSFPDASVSCSFLALADVVKKQLHEGADDQYFSKYWQSHSRQQQQAREVVQNRQAEERRDDVLQEILRLLQRPETDLQQAGKIMQPLLRAYVEKFRNFPEKVFAVFYRLLDLQEFPEQSLKEHIFSLESIYERKYHKPLRTTENIIASLLASVYGNRENFRLLQKTLEKSYERKYREKLIDPVEQLLAMFAQDSFTRDDYQELQRRLQQAYQACFGEPWVSDADRLVMELKELIGDYEKKR